MNKNRILISITTIIFLTSLNYNTLQADNKFKDLYTSINKEKTKEFIKNNSGKVSTGILLIGSIITLGCTTSRQFIINKLLNLDKKLSPKDKSLICIEENKLTVSKEEAATLKNQLAAEENKLTVSKKETETLQQQTDAKDQIINQLNQNLLEQQQKFSRSIEEEKEKVRKFHAFNNIITCYLSNLEKISDEVSQDPDATTEFHDQIKDAIERCKEMIDPDLHNPINELISSSWALSKNAFYNDKEKKFPNDIELHKIINDIITNPQGIKEAQRESIKAYLGWYDMKIEDVIEFRKELFIRLSKK